MYKESMLEYHYLIDLCMKVISISEFHFPHNVPTFEFIYFKSKSVFIAF